jgi:uncharacterized membrane protein (DUF2068 family)
MKATTARASGSQQQAVQPVQPLRAIAAFEAVKGLLALAAGLGWLALMHRDLHALAAALIGHIGLNPGGHYAALLLHNIDHLHQGSLSWQMLALAGYVAVRWLEAYGLWYQRRWGKWLGALSGALYVPFELQHFFHRPSLATAGVIALNLALVAYLGRQLWLQRARARSG